jgi:tetratricopeptide (TPR) repeat protein
MAKRYFNWKLAVVLVIGFAVLGGTAWGLRKWHRSRRAETGLGLGNAAYERRDWVQAAQNLGRYLAVSPGDVTTLLKYADAHLNIRPLENHNVQQAIAAYRSVLRADKGNAEAAVCLSTMYLAMHKAGEAELIAQRHFDANQTSSENLDAKTRDAKDSELRRIWAVALAEQKKFDQAAAQLENLLAEQPEQILAYETLGRLAERYGENFEHSPQYWYDQAVSNNPSSALAHLIRADFHFRGENADKALADLEQAEKFDLSDPVVRLRLAKGLINSNLLERAEHHLEAVQAAQPFNRGLWQAWFELALKSQSKAKMSAVAEAAMKALSPQVWDFLPRATELFIRADQHDRAQQCINQMKQEDVDPGLTAWLQGLIANRQGRLFEAVKYWRQTMELGQRGRHVRLALASALSRLGDVQSAQQQLRILISENAGFLDGHLALAKLAARKANWAEAAKHAQVAARISPDHTEAALLALKARIRLSASLSETEDNQIYKDIDQQLTQLEETTNGALQVRLLQVDLAMAKGDIEHAEALVGQLKQAYRSQPEALMAEAELLAAQQKQEQAILLLEDAVERFPSDPEPTKRLALLLARSDRHEACVAVIKDALAHFEEPAARRELSFLLCDFYERQNQQQDAYETLSSLVEQGPNDILAKRRLLRCTQVIENLDQAQPLIDQIKLLEGEDGWQWRYEQAKIWAAQGQFEAHYPQIVGLLEKNLLANPDDQASRLLLASTYERSDQLQLALSTYRDALHHAPDDLEVIIPAVSVFYKAKEYERAQEILDRASRQKLQHPQLQRLQLQTHLSRGKLNSAGAVLENLLAKDPQNSSACLLLVHLETEEGNLGKAEQLLAQLRAQKPDWLPAIVAQIRLYTQQKRSGEALRLCDQIVSSSNDAAAYILRAKTYAVLGQSDAAYKDFEQARAMEPNNVSAWLAESEFHRLAGQREQAIASIQKAMSLAPDNPNIQKQAIKLFLASQRPEIAQQGKDLLGKAIQLNPDDTELLLVRARVLLGERTSPAIESAEQILQDVTRQDPRIGQSWVLLGEIALGRGQFGKALGIALEGLAHVPNHKRLLLLKARVEAKRSTVLASHTLEVLHELDPSDSDVVVLLAETYVAANKPAKAVSLLRAQLTASEPAASRKCEIALATALYKNGDKQEALRLLESLCRSQPDDPDPLLAQVRLFQDEELWDQLNESIVNWPQDHPEDSATLVTVASELAASQHPQAKNMAEKTLRLVLASDAHCVSAMGALAMLLQTTGRDVEAAELYRQVLTLQPDHVVVINNLAWILCEQLGQHKQALELAQRGLEKTPNYIDLIDTRGVAYYRLGHLEKAVRDFQRCLTLYLPEAPSLVASYFHLGRALASLGQTDQAVENLTKALELNTKRGGLSDDDVAEAKRLIEQLSAGGQYVSVTTFEETR